MTKSNPLTIVTISPSRQPQKVWLKFSDGQLLPFKLDDVVVLGLKKITPLNDEIVQKIYLTSLKFILLSYALRQVAISPKNRSSLLPKIRQKSKYYQAKYHFPNQDYSKVTTEVIDYLDQNQLLDNKEFTQHLIDKYKNKSRKEISFLLHAQSANVDFSSLPPDRPKIVKLVNKKLKNQPKLDTNSKNRLISALVRKGFALPEVKSVIDDLTKF